MPWDNDSNIFYYTSKLLKVIARNYTEIYGGLPRMNSETLNPWVLAEFKADFDTALDSIGSGKWNDQIYSLKQCRFFGNLQFVVIGDILHVDNGTVSAYGIDGVAKLKKIAYANMCKRLNGG